MKSAFCILLTVLMTSCLAVGQTTGNFPAFSVNTDTLKLFDKTRKREVPIAVYRPENYTRSGPQELIILNHGYGANKGGDYFNYSYLTEYLASRGYLVVSIQHELPADSLIPSTGIPQVVRRPFWDRGADNIMFVINELKKSDVVPVFKQITLIGHSNGGDMAALFPQKYPGIVDRIITLDNRRMALPRTNKPKVYTLRSSDLPADEGVLPTEEEQRKFGIKIIKLENTIHNDMDDDATMEQREEIRKYIMTFLNE